MFWKFLNRAVTRFGEEFIFIASILESDLNCENSETVECTRLLHHLWNHVSISFGNWIKIIGIPLCDAWTVIPRKPHKEMKQSESLVIMHEI
jgi:hypothetical protein